MVVIRLRDDGNSPSTPSRALLEILPKLSGRLRVAALAELPTPVTALTDLAAALGRPGLELYEKRDDLSSPVYGGNKLRTLEMIFGDALARGVTHVCATGAYGSNHAAATALHAPRVGLSTRVLLFPQPSSRSALDNLELMLSLRPALTVGAVPHWSALPLAAWQQARASQRRGDQAVIMVPGGAVPLGALGHVSAGLELALQIDAGELPCPRTVVVAAGSNCTSAGLLVGMRLAARRGIGFREPPLLTSVRVVPWPVATRRRILALARQSSRLLAALADDRGLALGERELGTRLRVLTSYVGRGYGHATDEGCEAVALWDAHVGHGIETTYSGKAAAAAVDMVRSHVDGPILVWATKSSAPLPEVDPAALVGAPTAMRRWMESARRAWRPTG